MLIVVQGYFPDMYVYIPLCRTPSQGRNGHPTDRTELLVKPSESPCANLLFERFQSLLSDTWDSSMSKKLILYQDSTQNNKNHRGNHILEKQSPSKCRKVKLAIE